MAGLDRRQIVPRQRGLFRCNVFLLAIVKDALRRQHANMLKLTRGAGFDQVGHKILRMVSCDTPVM